MKKEFSLELPEQIQECEEIIKKQLPKEEGLQKTVLSAMNYSVKAGGKRIRPLLMKSAYGLFSEEDNKETHLLHAFMAAMEMIHTFSLCHDDLPCMDGDKYRRGQESTWYHFGEAMGTLAGDALVLFAYETVGKAYTEALKSIEGEDCIALSERFSRAFLRLSECSGIYGMLGGQVVDVEKTGLALEETELDFIYRLKTGALLAASLEIGGILSGADENSCRLLREIGEKVGIAFQIQDDILDETSTLEELGKPIHSDSENGKTTYISLFGMEKAKEEVSRLSEEAIELLQELSEKTEKRDFLEGLIRYLIHRKK